MANTSAFQADNAGSIPVIRSISSYELTMGSSIIYAALAQQARATVL